MPKGVLILIVGLLAAAVLTLIASWQLYALAIQRNRKTFLSSDPNMPHPEREVWEEMGAWYRSQPFEDVEMRSDDGLRLRAHYLEAQQPGRQTVILAHGYSGQGEDMAGFARIYHERGFHVLLPDNRGHGHSEGGYIGFGWHDRKDYVRWIGYLIERVGNDAQIVLHGVSMGGATVLMASGEPLPEQVKCIVSDCAYSSVKDILSYQLKQMFKLPAFPLLPMTSLISKWRAGFFFGEASAVNQLRSNSRPVLFIHGGKDTYVPTAMMDRLFEAAAGTKEKLVVPEARHGMSLLTEPQRYRETLLGFIGRYVI